MRGYVRFAMAAAFAAGILMYPEKCLLAARAAMANWVFSVAPALFPFLAVLPCLTCEAARRAYEFLFGGIMKRVFGLPGGCASALLIGLAAGSPACAIAVSRVAQEEGITKGQAERLAGLCCGVGPIYVISGMGVALLGSASEGWRLAISQAVALIITGLSFRRAWRRDVAPLVSAQNDIDERPIIPAVLAILRVCGYMVVFSVLFAIINIDSVLIMLFLDLPTGASLASAVPGWQRAAALGFGGACIISQNMAYLSRIGVSATRFIIQKVYSALVCALLYILIGEINVPAIGGAAEWPLLIMCILLLPVITICIYFLTKQKRLLNQ